MSQSEDNNYFNGDWDNQSELYWNEREWSVYLKGNAAEQARFLTFYFKLRGQPGHLDLVARQMGWEIADWAAANEDVFADNNNDDDDDETPPPIQLPPYCVQQHPVFIVTRALCGHLNFVLEKHCASAGHTAPTTGLALAFARALRETEHALIMAVTAMDTADFALTLCLAKHALVGINQAMGLLEKLPQNGAAAQQFIREFRSVLFDLRDLALRVINDSHWELDNPADGE